MTYILRRRYIFLKSYTFLISKNFKNKKGGELLPPTSSVAPWLLLQHARCSSLRDLTLTLSLGWNVLPYTLMGLSPSYPFTLSSNYHLTEAPLTTQPLILSSPHPGTPHPPDTVLISFPLLLATI